MRVTTSTISATALRQIQDLNARLSKLQIQVSTGQRISQPEDDPAAVGRLITLQDESKQLDQFQQNAARALEISQASTSALQEIKTLSDRATELATLGSSTESSDSARSYATEANQLLEQAVQLANSSLRNDHLFAGTAVDTAPFQISRDSSGNITGVTYAGSTDVASIPLSDTASIAPATTAQTNQGLADFINHLVSLRDALNQNDPAAVAGVQSGLLTTEDTIINAISDQGAIQMRIQLNQDQQQNRSTEIEKLISNDANIDMSQAIVRYNQVQVAYQAALQSTASIMNLSLLDYLQ
ncbi:MAG: flagellin [Opitutaceae bacterium]|nr:flagellin [Opitutaceae bacterium]